MSDAEVDLPYVDEHAIRIAAPREVVWPVLHGYAEGLGAGPHDLVGRLLGTEPRSGFALDEVRPPEHLSLVGRHRFSAYRLVFELSEVAGGATQLRAQTYAAFPGPRGRVYRAVVIGSRGHVVAVRSMLRTVRSRSTARPGPAG